MLPILPLPPLPTPLPTLPITWLVNLFKSLLKKPKKDDTTKEVAERAAQQRAFCDAIKQESSALEDLLVKQIKDLAQSLEKSCDMDEFPVLSKYPINAKLLVSQAGLLSMQIHGLIAAEVSARMTDSDSEFHRINWMLSGMEKESAMHAFIDDVMKQAANKCAEVCESIIDTIQEEFSEMQRAVLDDCKKQLEMKSTSISLLSQAAENQDAYQLAEQVAKAKCVIDCCTLVCRELDLEE